ncbi:site-specific DNA-methyltransferase [Spirulina subsalsa FACHB-351]|uniref:Methyltransferase n=1 Tax=Spirulina subsalsa FACHB-351 TaxID=234711 RepID=A0ABT3LB28_9CYAN|nr:site-specific DNA-methyltransferase [Spirulina subsalsa]MCW6038289.1 site-specific DNA-methyltransferase [Spirulina subsalsa FACHB-351]
MVGKRLSIEVIPQHYHLQFDHPNGKLYQGDAIPWLSCMESESIDLIFADPPYNLKKAHWDNFETQKQYIDWSLKWIEQAARVLKKQGTMYVCGFSEVLADLKHPSMKFFQSCRWLIWHYKNKANLGHDWGRSHESILHFRKTQKVRLNIDDIRIPYRSHTLKYPSHPQAETSQYNQGKKRQDIWTPHPKGAKPKDVIEIPITCNGMNESTPHPTQKPEALLRKFILASSQAGDTILDPFSGSGTTLVAAEQLGRKWLGCDLDPQYNIWAMDRLDRVEKRSVEEWILYDQKIAERREKVRFNN